jgi:hypothetical protein
MRRVSALISALVLLVGTWIIVIASAAGAVQGAQAPVAAGPPPPGGGSVSTGPADPGTIRPGAPAAVCTSGLVKDGPGGNNFNAGTIATVKADDGRSWTVPAPVNVTGAGAADVFNNCTNVGDVPDPLAKLQTVVVDPDGVEITAYVFGDNYFELYVNGRFVARDPVGMTPFNSNVVRFRARSPMTYALMGVDWETHHGIGMEYPQFNIGDAGMIAYFSDGNGTHADWRVESFYIAPLDDPSCVRVAAGHDSTGCHQAEVPACAKDPKTCKALHFPIPSNWTAPGFDDSRWQRATTWPPAAVTGQRAYTGYAKLFGDAEFIWTGNLKLDNLVLARYTAKAPRR